MNSQQRLGTLVFIPDSRLSREKSALLMRIFHGFKGFTNVKLLPPHIDQEQLLEELALIPDVKLILAPWYLYLIWSKVEALYGLTRTSGPTFAGYFTEELRAEDLGGEVDHIRAILLDFSSMDAREIRTMVHSLVADTRRAGIRPLLASASTPVYCESWYGGMGLGSRMDQVCSIPEFTQYEWNSRAKSLRLCLSAFWSLVYEIGPGKTAVSQPTPGAGARSPRAYFQFAADVNLCVMRLMFCMPSWSPKDALSTFWPGASLPAGAPELLLRYSDFLRVHSIAETHDLEIVAGFLRSAPSERQPNCLHTLWIEPIAAALVSEVPFEVPGPHSPHLRVLPPQGRGGADGTVPESAEQQIRELRELVAKRDELIAELRSGGVGTANPLPPPDAEAFLDAFQEKYLQARQQISEFEARVREIERDGDGVPGEVVKLRGEMRELATREEDWIRKLSSFIDIYRESRKRS